MAVDKFSGSGLDVASLLSRTLLENTIARFDELMATHDRKVIRRRLKERIGDVEVNLNGQREEETSRSC